ncbi:MAG TPA: hypothetical protein VN775_11180 [Opitutaceae bacterium]|nr:hypothetical protein [Opitutaceae bacterium]
MAPKRIRVALFGSTLFLGVLLLSLVLIPRLVRRRPETPAVPAHGAATGLPAGAGAPATAGSEDRSHLADGLNAPGGNVRSDMRLVDQIFAAYRGALRSGNPTGENAEITAVLAGRNRLGFAFIPPDNPAINPKGELCDRWGTPYFFHQLSGERMEIRSAGPDRKLWTADDEVLTP